MDVLGERMVVAEKIGALKKQLNVAVLQNNRWNEILEKMTQKAVENNLSETFVVQVFKAIHQESIAKQEKVFKGQ